MSEEPALEVVGVAALLSLMAVLLAASWVPARRASLLDPMRALSSE